MDLLDVVNEISIKDVEDAMIAMYEKRTEILAELVNVSKAKDVEGATKLLRQLDRIDDVLEMLDCVRNTEE